MNSKFCLLLDDSGLAKSDILYLSSALFLNKLIGVWLGLVCYDVVSMGSYQIWPCHATQAENLSFFIFKILLCIQFWKSCQISWFCCIPNGSYKEDNLKEGRICPPPPPPCGIGLKVLGFVNIH